MTGKSSGASIIVRVPLGERGFCTVNLILRIILDRRTESLSTEKNAKPNSYDVNMVNLKHLAKADFKLISLSKGGLPILPELDHGKIARRARDAINDKMKAADKVGINVSIEAQKLFDLMSNL